jgi:VIT1/CCC1 family predicted Fe2+/Mn2+ transporter
MNGTPASPICPRCRRKLAAWRLDHCIYCGEKFPENIREGFTEPEALKFVERPAVSSDAARQLEMMKYVEIGAKPKQKTSVAAALALLTLPVFAGIFYMLYRLVSRAYPSFAILIVVAALLFLGYLGWSVAKSAR